MTRVVAVAGPGIVITGQFGPVMVMSRCGLDIAIGYWCESHKRFFSTLEAFVEHLNDATLANQDHRNIAVYCPHHRTLEAAPVEQIRALAGEAA